MGVNPARAGMILNLRCLIVAAFGKPRASGDDPEGSLQTRGVNK